MLNKQNTFFCISKLLEALPGTQFITMFSPPGINSWFLRVPLKVLQFENLDSGNENVFLNGLRVYKEGCDTSNFTVCKFKQLFESQNLLWERSLHKYCQHYHKKENLKAYARILLSWRLEQLRISIPRAHSHTLAYL